MLSKSKIKLIVQLKQKKYREINNMFIAEGTINVLDFLQSDAPLIDLYATKDWMQLHQMQIKNLNSTIVTTKELKKISALSTPSDVIGVFSLPDTTFSGNIDTDNFTIALDNISDPGNLGTIIRTADWFGIRNIYCSNETVDAYNPKVVQATMGSLARVKVHYTNLKDLLESRPDNLPILGAVLNGTRITELKTQSNGIILIGSEAHGISKGLLPFVTQKITIPSFNSDSTNGPESLNASIATAIICYALKSGIGE